MPTIYQLGQRIDHYEIIRLLGRGGASHVYLAWDRRSWQEVVLKVPLEDVIGGRAIFERYRREAEIGKRLIHPALQQHLSICEALVYVHAHGVIHRDIKPENILLLETGQVKLLDFGIALLVKKERRFPWRGHSSPVGTPDYMAPERWRGEAGSVQSDIYAVGVVLYELLCGRTPFQETDGFAIISQHSSHDPPDILHFNPTLSASLATIVMRAIRRDPKKRYASMQELLNDLDHLDKVVPVDYLPDPPLLGGRYRQALLIALLVFVICLGLIAFGILAQFAHHAVR